MKKLLSIVIIGILLITIHSCSALSIQRTSVSDNESPVADAGGPYFVCAGKSVLLDGSDSYDPDGHIVDWYWWIHNPPAFPKTIGDGDKIEHEANPKFIKPIKIYQVGLRVTDNQGETSTSYAKVFCIKGRLSLTKTPLIWTIFSKLLNF
jgi:hypothetical protein